jgi:DNA repair ATPase RecN
VNLQEEIREIVRQEIGQGMKVFDELFRSLETEMRQGFAQVSERLDRTDARLDRMETRLNLIAAGSKYVVRLAEWADKQDLFQAEAMRRLNELADRISKLEARP